MARGEMGPGSAAHRTGRCLASPGALRCVRGSSGMWRALSPQRHCEEPLRRSNPESLCEKTLDCFVASAQNCCAILSRAPRSDGARGGIATLQPAFQVSVPQGGQRRTAPCPPNSIATRAWARWRFAHPTMSEVVTRRHTFTISRRIPPELCSSHHALIAKGRREGRAPAGTRLSVVR